MPNDIDLTALSATERAILALLAQGHTAKSIAAEIGRTEGAVNERLREARRKTGVGSSRELARLVRTQESRDEQTGMAVDDRPAPDPAGASLLSRWQGKVLLMTISIIALVAAALALRAPNQQVPSVPPVPPVTPVPPAGSDVDGSAARMRMAFDGEARDPAWADGAANLLAHRYRMAGGADLATLIVACHTTLCTVRGQSISDAGSQTGTSISHVLGSPAFRRSVPGLHADVTDASSFVRGKVYVVAFDAIWRRTAD